MATALLIAIQLVLHPFHVSVTDIKYKEEKKALQITSRIFLDDLELALRDYSGNEDLDITEESSWEDVNEYLKGYVLERISLWDQRGRLYSLNYIGAEIENDVMWCYLEIAKVKKLGAIRVKNELLTEVWADQENLVHFRAYEKVKSQRLYKGASTTLFEWK